MTLIAPGVVIPVGPTYNAIQHLVVFVLRDTGVEEDSAEVEAGVSVVVEVGGRFISRTENIGSNRIS